MSKGKVAIVGLGEVPTRWDPERAAWEMVCSVCMEAVKDANLTKDDIDGMVCVNPMGQPRLSSEVSFGKAGEELGFKNLRDSCTIAAGGASSAESLRFAEYWINTGIAKNVLILHVTKYSNIPVQDLINYFATAGISSEWEYPFGVTYNGFMGLLTTRYMYDTGTTPEEMASITVSLRKWAALDPLCLMYGREPPSIEKVLSSKLTSTPIHTRESNVLCDGAAAIIMTSAERAADITDTPVYKWGEGSAYNMATMTQRPNRFTKETRERAGAPFREAFGEAGLTVKDMDILEIYGSYPVACVQLLEACGAVELGMGAKTFATGRCDPGGDLPTCTIGDALGKGHTGSGIGMAYYVECARQLMGKAPKPKQVPNPKFVVTDGAGGTGYNLLVTIFGREKP